MPIRSSVTRLSPSQTEAFIRPIDVDYSTSKESVHLGDTAGSYPSSYTLIPAVSPQSLGHPLPSPKFLINSSLLPPSTAPDRVHLTSGRLQHGAHCSYHCTVHVAWTLWPSPTSLTNFSLLMPSTAPHRIHRTCGILEHGAHGSYLHHRSSLINNSAIPRIITQSQATDAAYSTSRQLLRARDTAVSRPLLMSDYVVWPSPKPWAISSLLTPTTAPQNDHISRRCRRIKLSLEVPLSTMSLRHPRGQRTFPAY